MKSRLDRVNSLLEHEISGILLKEFSFPGAMATLTRVNATPNLIEARVYISVFPEEKADEVIRGLKKDVRLVQRKINKKLNMRPVPKIIFVKDSHISSASKVETLLNKLRNN